MNINSSSLLSGESSGSEVTDEFNAPIEKMEEEIELLEVTVEATCADPTQSAADPVSITIIYYIYLQKWKITRISLPINHWLTDLTE